jgi:translocation and assembly module TamB
VENGRVHHRNLALTGKNMSLTTSGSVGFDGSLQLNVEMPIPNRLIEQAFKNNPRIKEALQKKTISVSLGGTVTRPSLDARAMQANVQKLIADASRDALKDAAGGLLQKELDKNLEKLLPKKKP